MMYEPLIIYELLMIYKLLMMYGMFNKELSLVGVLDSKPFNSFFYIFTISTSIMYFLHCTITLGQYIIP